MSHSIRYAQPLQIPDDSVDESDPADNGDGADAVNATTSTAAGSAESVAAQTLLIAVKSACFNRVMVWFSCHAGILASVAVAQTLSHPLIVVARYAAHSFARCCDCNLYG